MVDFRVDMVRASGEDNAPHMVLLHIPESFLPFSLHIFPGVAKLCPGFVCRINDFLGGKFGKLFD